MFDWFLVTLLEQVVKIYCGVVKNKERRVKCETYFVRNYKEVTKYFGHFVMHYNNFEPI